MTTALSNREIRVGDCRALLRELPDESVNCVVTSPPYFGLRDYGVDGQIGLEETPEAFVAEMVAVFREARRALTKDGTLWLNLGDSFAQGGRGGILKPKDLIGIPWMVAFALRADGWYLRSDIVWHKPNPMPESVQDRPTKAHEFVFLLSKSQRYFYDAKAIREPVTGGAHARGNGVNPKARGGDHPRNIDSRYHAPGQPEHTGLRRNGLVDERNKRSVWTIGSEPFSGAHFATFPRKLVEPCILAGCPAGGLVLDPFGGSGTVGEVAEALGRRWMLLELNPAYAELARARTAQRGLFGDVAAAAIASSGGGGSHRDPRPDYAEGGEDVRG